jgi:hypothetical protein
VGRSRIGRLTTAMVVTGLLMGSGVAQAAAPSNPPPRPIRTDVGDATVHGPVARDVGLHGRPQTDHTADLRHWGYLEEEYFLSGEARSFDAGVDPATYTTRMIVRRPADPRRFNGTVIVEWNNVTAQHDQTPDWFWARPMVLREGYAYAIVSAQQAGHCCAPLSLVTADPLRYARMDHPGDTYAYDIFSQAVKALRAPAGVDPMDGQRPRHVLAAGHSQSASRLHGYLHTADPTARLIDGFLVDGGGSKRFTVQPRVPVIHLLEEFGFTPDEPTATRNYRLWEVAGAAHADYWILRQQFDAPERALPRQPQHDAGWAAMTDEIAGNYGTAFDPRQLTCAGGGNLFPKRYAVSAALVRLDEWARTGRPAPAVPRVQFGEDGQPERDEHGNVVGGLRLPPIDAPVATYLGDTCVLFGITIPFTPTKLRTLYPTHEDYVRAMEAATVRSVRQGILLPADAADLLRRARTSRIPDLTLSSPLPTLPGRVPLPMLPTLPGAPAQR